MTKLCVFSVNSGTYRLENCLASNETLSHRIDEAIFQREGGIADPGTYLCFVKDGRGITFALYIKRKLISLHALAVSKAAMAESIANLGMNIKFYRKDYALRDVTAGKTVKDDFPLPVLLPDKFPLLVTFMIPFKYFEAYSCESERLACHVAWRYLNRWNDREQSVETERQSNARDRILNLMSPFNESETSPPLESNISIFK